MSTTKRRNVTTIGTSVSIITKDRKRRTRVVNSTKPVVPTPIQPSGNITQENQLSEAFLDSGYDEFHGEVTVKSGRVTKGQQEFMAEWSRKAPDYLSSILMHESIGAVSLCVCGSEDLALYKCTTCLCLTPLCKACIAAAHQRIPLHRIVYWNGYYFESIVQSEIGICLSIPHADGRPCSSPTSNGTITVVDINGFHDLDITFCGCENAAALDIQLLSAQLFAASVTSPKTAFTFQLLEQFRILHLESKTSVHSFVNMLARLTAGDDFGIMPVKDRSREFRCVSRQWNYIVAQKQSSPDNPSASLVVACPACPQPGINMPHDWIQKSPPEKHWLARQFVHFDANFRLVLNKRKQDSSDDMGLWEGRGFFVEEEPYKEYLRTVDAVQQVSTCSNHRAVSSANGSRFLALDVTGIAGGVCRHECAIPGSFVNLFKGERYVNSDYAISNALSKLPTLKEIVLSYDIACQYSKQFFNRFANSQTLQLPDTQITFLVPKFHLPAHKEDCRFQYSFNYAKGVGRTDGEGIERFWSPHNWLSGSTSKMTHLSRMDTLNLHFSDWNMRKARRMAHELHNRSLKAREQADAHEVQFSELCDALDANLVERWIDLEQNHILGGVVRSIYQVATEKAPTRAAVLLDLTRMETEEGNRMEMIGRPDVVIWINDGLEIEETQRIIRLRRKTVNVGARERDHVLLARQRIALWNRIVEWRARGIDYNPGDDIEDIDPVEHPEDDEIILPSSQPIQERSPQLSHIELRLREGQANDALKAIRMALSQKLVLRRDKQANICGQRDTNRSTANIRRLDTQIERFTEQYRRAYSTMISLGMPVIHQVYRPLNKEDLNYNNVFQSDRPLGRGYEPPVSWIWHMNEAGGLDQLDDNWLEEVSRVQFLEMKVNKERWEEEVELLGVELERVGHWFRHTSEVWRRQAGNQHIGIAAYSARMASTYDKLNQEVLKLIG